MLSRTVRCGKSRKSWKTTPTRRSSGGTTAAPALTIRSSTRMIPDASGSRPAMAATSVDFPAPFGPTSASGRPGSASNAAVTVNAPRSTVASTAQRVAHARTPGSQRSRRASSTTTETDEQHQRERDRRLRIGLQRQVAGDRQRARHAGQRAGERDRRAELAERAGEAEHRAGRDARRDQRHGHQPEHLPPVRAERRRRGLGAPVGGAERPLDREHQERHRHERLREHHRARRVRDAEAGIREELADDAAAAEQQEQRDAAHDGRQHERDGDRGAQQAARDEAPAGAVREQQRERDAEHQAQRRRDERR